MVFSADTKRTAALLQAVADSKILPEELDLHKELGKLNENDRVGLMWPTSFAKNHPASPLLDAYSKVGCPVDVSKPWEIAQLVAALERGAHPLARKAEALAYLL